MLEQDSLLGKRCNVVGFAYKILEPKDSIYRIQTYYVVSKKEKYKFVKDKQFEELDWRCLLPIIKELETKGCFPKSYWSIENREKIAEKLKQLKI